ncbi:hypothetical protein PENSPDRAFT_739906 [Peniophora sp. CONT]|nr:hypothetical protein PENSPDRAFT_739906 [Peniophora sp. CONT]
MPSSTRVRFASSHNDAVGNAYAREYGVPNGYGASPHTKDSSRLVPTPRVTTFDIAPVLKPYGGNASVTPAQPATAPTVRTLVLQLPQPFAPVDVSPTGTELHVTVHDVWAAARQFRHAPASREELEALSEADRKRVKETYYQRVGQSRSPTDGLRREDFLCGATIIGFVPVAGTPDTTIALVLGKAP